MALLGGLLFWAVPGAGLLSLIGLILMLLAVKQISESMADPQIFRDYLIYFVVALIAVVVTVVAVGGAVALVLTGGFVGGMVALLGGLAVAWILYLIAAIFLRKSYGVIASKLGVSLFSTTGLLYLIGAALVIVVIGFFILLVAQILQIIAFFSLPDQSSGASAAPKPPAAA